MLDSYDWFTKAFNASSAAIAFIEASTSRNIKLLSASLTKIDVIIAVLDALAYPEFRLNNKTHF